MMFFASWYLIIPDVVNSDLIRSWTHGIRGLSDRTNWTKKKIFFYIFMSPHWSTCINTLIFPLSSSKRWIEGLGTMFFIFNFRAVQRIDIIKVASIPEYLLWWIQSRGVDFATLLTLWSSLSAKTHQIGKARGLLILSCHLNFHW